MNPYAPPLPPSHPIRTGHSTVSGATAATTTPPKAQPTRTLAVTSLAVAIVGLALVAVPYTGLLSVALGLTGVGLGIAVVAGRGRIHGRWPAVAGIALSGVAVLVPITSGLLSAADYVREVSANEPVPMVDQATAYELSTAEAAAVPLGDPATIDGSEVAVTAVHAGVGPVSRRYAELGMAPDQYFVGEPVLVDVTVMLEDDATAPVLENGELELFTQDGDRYRSVSYGYVVDVDSVDGLPDDGVPQRATVTMALDMPAGATSGAYVVITSWFSDEAGAWSLPDR